MNNLKLTKHPRWTRAKKKIKERPRRMNLLQKTGFLRQNWKKKKPAALKKKKEIMRYPCSNKKICQRESNDIYELCFIDWEYFNLFLTRKTSIQLVHKLQTYFNPEDPRIYWTKFDKFAFKFLPCFFYVT